MASATPLAARELKLLYFARTDGIKPKFPKEPGEPLGADLVPSGVCAVFLLGSQEKLTTSDGVNSYQYDAEGRLRSAGLGGSTVSVVYNALGETVERSSTGGVAYRQENLYDPEGRELANYDGADGYWWGRNIALGNRNVALYFSNYVRFVHSNNLGTTTAVTDQTGSLLQDQLYYPWGQQWTTAGSPQDLHFASLEQLEPDLGMYPTPHRRYTPTLGRWLTPDPGGLKAVNPADPQTWNMYAYAGNNPTTRTDPSGLYFVVDSNSETFFLAALAKLYQRPEGRALVSALAASSKPVILDRSELTAGEGGVSRAMFNKTQPGAFAGVHVTVGTDADLFKAAVAAPGQVGPAKTTAHELEHAEAGLSAGKGGLAAGAAAMAVGDAPSSPGGSDTLGGSAQARANAIMAERADMSKKVARTAVRRMLGSGNQQWLNNADRQALCTQNNLHAFGCK